MHAALAPRPRANSEFHEDIQPEHLVVEEKTVHIIGWKASAQGSVACDRADIMFHLARDLVYTDVDPQRLPADVIGRVPVSGAVLAWRAVQWLDGRRPCDIETLSPDDLQ